MGSTGEVHTAWRKKQSRLPKRSVLKNLLDDRQGPREDCIYMLHRRQKPYNVEQCKHVLQLTLLMVWTPRSDQWPGQLHGKNSCCASVSALFNGFTFASVRTPFHKWLLATTLPLKLHVHSPLVVVLYYYTVVSVILYLEVLLFHVSAWNTYVYSLTTFKVHGFFV